MSLSINHLYEFCEFRLDTKERTLSRGGHPVELTPKAFELLTVLLENHGKLIEKSELMARLWADSFVEESNLTYNIRQLRKILGDSAHEPTYIKTVPRFGYRFVAPVTEDLADEVSAKLEGVGLLRAAPDIRKRSAPRLLLGSLARIAATIVILATFIAAASWLWMDASVINSNAAPLLKKQFTSRQLTTTGGVYQAAISVDGKKVAYSSEVGGNQSIWIKDLDSSETVQIVPESKNFYYGLEFGDDGSTLYFARGRQNSEVGNIDIYKTSVSGGLPKEVVKNASGRFSLSPDGQQISFVRCPNTEDENCSLYIASVDGGSEIKLLSRQHPIVIQENQFSPDGKSVAFAFGQSRKGAREMGLAEIEIATRIERLITQDRFYQIGHFDWLPDQSGLLVSVFEEFYEPTRVFHVSADTGESRALTRDGNTYNHISMDRAGERMVTTRFSPKFTLTVAQVADMKNAKKLASGFSDVVISPSGKVVFSSTTDGNLNLWSMDADGTNQRQLTATQGSNWHPRVSPDERYIFFTSNRNGSNCIWRMKMDGSDQVQLIGNDVRRPVFASADGTSLYYQTAIGLNLAKITTDPNGSTASIPVSEFRMEHPSIDAGEKTVAFFSKAADSRYEINLQSLADGKILKTFKPANPDAIPSEIVWSQDGRSIFYVNKERSINIVWRQYLNAAKPERFAELGDEEVTDLAISKDGRAISYIRGRWDHDAFLIEGLE